MSWWIFIIHICLCKAETWHNHNGKSYYIYSQGRNHFSARSACEARDSMLAVITSREDSDFIAGLTAHGQTYFIGLTGPDDCEPSASEACRQKWGTDGTVTDFTDWGNERPLARRGCGVFKGGASAGAWDAGTCDSTRTFICQNNCQPEECHQTDCNFVHKIYKCTCEPDYSGIHCATKIDDCASDPCEHGATCIDGVNSYTCDCLPVYTGTYCETDIDECAPNPCNNGTCDDLINDFQCHCHPGFTGALCEQELDECACNDNIASKQQNDMGLVVALSVLLGLITVAFLITLVLAIWISKKYRQVQRQNKSPNQASSDADNENYCKLQMQSNPVSTAEIYYNIK